ncbi:hypothetical protein [Christiangramia sp.]|uniref:hypothetical protein n=1 Tax=Christiangramia sp. TaxID=1931228 RepID=UPI00261286F7|nr:hypothetical protein [Christiangramia sp.]
MESFVKERNLYLEETIKFFSEKEWESKNDVYFKNNGAFFFFTIVMEELKIKIYCNPLYREIDLEYATAKSRWFNIYELDGYLENPLKLEKMNIRDNFDNSYKRLLNFVYSNIDFMRNTDNWILK